MGYRTVLLIDNDDERRQTLEKYLEELSFQSLSCPDLEIALSKIRHFRADIAILDAQLLARNGLAPLYRLKTSAPTLFIVLLNDQRHQVPDLDFTNEGIESYILYPLAPEAFKTAMQQILTTLRIRDDANREVSELRKQNQYYHSLLNVLSDAIVVVNQNYTIQFCNAAFEKMMGSPLAILQDQSLQEFIEDGFKVLHYVSQQLTLGKSIANYRIGLKPVTGKMFDVNMSAEFFSSEAGYVEGMILSFENRTLSDEVFTALVRKEKLATIQELASALAHEIQNPTNILSGRVQLLQQNNQQPPDEKSFEIINRQLNRISDIIAQLRRFNNRKEDTIPAALPLVEFLADFLIEREKKEPFTYQIHYKKAEEGVLVQANPQQLHDAFTYLFRIIETIVPAKTRLHIYCRLLKSAAHPSNIEIQINFNDSQGISQSLQMLHNLQPCEDLSILDIALMHTLFSYYGIKVTLETLVGHQQSLKLQFAVSGVKNLHNDRSAKP